MPIPCVADLFLYLIPLSDPEERTKELLVAHGVLEHAWYLFSTGHSRFVKRKTSLALLILLNELTRIGSGMLKLNLVWLHSLI